MKKIFIHIGHSKTGSTSIQRYLRDHESSLLKNGFTLYKGKHKDSNHIELFLGAIRHDRDSFAKQNFPDITFDQHYTAQIKQRVHQFIASAETTNVIFTTEGLSFLRHADEMDRLLDIFEDHTDDITIILYLRNKADFLKSYTKQVLRKKSRTTAQAFDSTLYVEPDTWLIDYDALTTLYQKAFGKHSVVLVDYDQEMETLSNVIPSFIKTLGIPAGDDDLSAYFFNKQLRKTKKSNKFIQAIQKVLKTTKNKNS